MAKQVVTTTTTTDDIDNPTGAETVTFSLDGTDNTVDLSKKNRALAQEQWKAKLNERCTDLAPVQEHRSPRSPLEAP